MYSSAICSASGRVEVGVDAVGVGVERGSASRASRQRQLPRPPGASPSCARTRRSRARRCRTSRRAGRRWRAGARPSRRSGPARARIPGPASGRRPSRRRSAGMPSGVRRRLRGRRTASSPRSAAAGVRTHRWCSASSGHDHQEPPRPTVDDPGDRAGPRAEGCRYRSDRGDAPALPRRLGSPGRRTPCRGGSTEPRRSMVARRSSGPADWPSCRGQSAVQSPVAGRESIRARGATSRRTRADLPVRLHRVRPRVRAGAELQRRRADRLPRVLRPAAQGLQRGRRGLQGLRLLPHRLPLGLELHLAPGTSDKSSGDSSSSSTTSTPSKDSSASSTTGLDVGLVLVRLRLRHLLTTHRPPASLRDAGRRRAQWPACRT